MFKCYTCFTVLWCSLHVTCPRLLFSCKKMTQSCRSHLHFLAHRWGTYCLAGEDLHIRFVHQWSESCWEVCFAGLQSRGMIQCCSKVWLNVVGCPGQFWESGRHFKPLSSQSIKEAAMKNIWMNNEYRECQRKNRVLRQSNAMCRPKHFCFLIFIMKSLSELAPVPVCVGTMAAHTFLYDSQTDSWTFILKWH